MLLLRKYDVNNMWPIIDRVVVKLGEEWPPDDIGRIETWRSANFFRGMNMGRIDVVSTGFNRTEFRAIDYDLFQNTGVIYDCFILSLHTKAGVALKSLEDIEDFFLESVGRDKRNKYLEHEGYRKSGLKLVYYR